MATATRGVRDDRVLTYTRVLSGVIVPFLLAAFVILYVFPGETKRLFAWTIKPTMTPMVLASAYLGGAYFFVRVLRERRWTVIKTGFLSVALMLVAAVRARSELDPGRPLTWLMAVGFVAVLASSGRLWYAMEVRPRRASPIREGL